METDRKLTVTERILPMAGRPKTMSKKVMEVWTRYEEAHCDAMRLVPERSRKTEPPGKDDALGRLWHAFRKASLEAEVDLYILAKDLCESAGIPDWWPTDESNDGTLDQADHDDEALPKNPELEYVGT